MKKIGFDSKLYRLLQKREILKRLKGSNRLYLEIGGKLCFDGHASRVLPGFELDNKIKLIKSLKNFEIIYCINSEDIERRKELQDFNLAYEKQAFKDFKDIACFGAKVSYVVFTKFNNQISAIKLKEIISSKGIPVYLHRVIDKYTKNPRNAINGFESMEYIPVKKRIVVVTGAAGGSGKMAVALSQMFYEIKKGERPRFAKYELFPIWNLSISHPINIAYEAATADLGDKIMIDKLSKHNSVNYNRDIYNFKILKKLVWYLSYKSPTDMGINMAKFAIINDKICRKAAINEIVNRYFIYLSQFRRGIESFETIERMKKIIWKVRKFL